MGEEAAASTPATPMGGGGGSGSSSSSSSPTSSPTSSSSSSSSPKHAIHAAAGAAIASLATLADFAAAAAACPLPDSKLAAALHTAAKDALALEVCNVGPCELLRVLCASAPAAMYTTTTAATASSSSTHSTDASAATPSPTPTPTPSLPAFAACLARAYLLLHTNYGPLARSLPFVGLDAHDELGAPFPGLGPWLSSAAEGGAGAGGESLHRGLGGMPLLPRLHSQPATLLAATALLGGGGAALGLGGGDSRLGPGAALRGARGSLLLGVKQGWLQALAGATSTHVSDDPEDPIFNKPALLGREERQAHVGTDSTKMLALGSAEGRVAASTFGQLEREAGRMWEGGSIEGPLRRAFLFAGTGGQRRAFFAKIVGSTAEDQGGPYRSVFEVAFADLALGAAAGSGGSSGAQLPDSAPMALPFLTPTPNFHLKPSEEAAGSSSSSTGDFLPGTFTLNPSPLLTSLPAHRGQLAFLGRLLGCAVRGQMCASLFLTPKGWRAVGGLGGCVPADLWALNRDAALALGLRPASTGAARAVAARARAEEEERRESGGGGGGGSRRSGGAGTGAGQGAGHCRGAAGAGRGAVQWWVAGGQGRCQHSAQQAQWQGAAAANGASAGQQKQQQQQQQWRHGH